MIDILIIGMWWLITIIVSFLVGTYMGWRWTSKSNTLKQY